MKKTNRFGLFSVESLEQRILLSADPIASELASHYHDATHDNFSTFEQVSFHSSSQEKSTQLTQENAPLSIKIDDFAKLETESGQITIGDENSNAWVQLGNPKTANALTFNQNVVINNPQAGGEIFIDSDLTGGQGANLTINGSGKTSILSANVTTQSDASVIINDSLKIRGNRVISTGLNMQLGALSQHFLDGDGISGDDSLTLSTNATGNIIVKGVVGATDPLESLTVLVANNVTFEKDVTMNGDLTILATGTVTFNGALSITNGALKITGAKFIVFGNSVVVDSGKDIMLEGDEIEFNGSQASVRGTGLLTLRPTDKTHDISIASPPSENLEKTLNLSSREITTFGNDFTKIIIGRESTTDIGRTDANVMGNVYIGSKAENQTTFASPVEIYGKSISVKDYSNPNLKFYTKNTLKLDALNDISIANEIKAGDANALKNITLYSANGKVKQENNAEDNLINEEIMTQELIVFAETGIELSAVNASLVYALNLDNDNVVGSGNISIHITSAVQTTTTFSIISGIETGNIRLSSEKNSLLLDSELKTTSGNIVINSGAMLTVNKLIATTSGMMDFKAKNTLTLNNNITSLTGALKMESVAGDIWQNASVSSTGSGGLITFVAGENIVMKDGVKTSTSDNAAGSIIFQAGKNVALSVIEAQTIITIQANAGSIIDISIDESENIKGTFAAVSLFAAYGIGSINVGNINTQVFSLTAKNQSTGSIFIAETDDLKIVAGGIVALGTEGYFGLLVGKQLDIDSAISTQNNVLLQSVNSINLNARLSSVNGNISVISTQGDMALTSTGDIEISASPLATIELEAALAITMADGATIKTKGATARLQAKAGNLTVGGVDVESGSLSFVTASLFSVLDAGDFAGDIINATNLRIVSGGIGLATQLLEMNVSHLNVQASQGGIFIQEQNGLSISEIAALNINHVLANATTTVTGDDSALSNFQTAGNLVLNALDGEIIIQKAVSSQNNIRIQTKGALTLNAPIISEKGSIHLTSGSTITQTADGDIKTADIGTIQLNAGAGIVMLQGAFTTAKNGNVLYQAQNAISVSEINAVNANVAILTQGELIETSKLPLTTTPPPVITAGSLYLEMGNGIASTPNLLKINVDNLAVKTQTGDVFISDMNALTIKPLIVSVNSFTTDNFVQSSTTISAAGIETNSAGGLIVVMAENDLTLQGTDNLKFFQSTKNSNVLLQSLAGNLIFDGVLEHQGNISFIAKESVSFLQYTQMLTAGTMDIEAGKNIEMTAGAKIETINKNIRLNALNGDIKVAKLQAGTGHVSLLAQGSIFDNNEKTVNIVANGLQITATGSIGAANKALDTQITLLNALAENGAIFIQEQDDLGVSFIDLLDVNRIGSTANYSVIPITQQSGLKAAQAVVIISESGSIHVLETDDLIGIRTKDETGNVLLQAANNVHLQANLTTENANVTLLAGGEILLDATSHIIVKNNGTIDLEAKTITSQAGSAIQSMGGNIRLNSKETILISYINAIDGSVSLQGKYIIDNAGEEISIEAKNLRLNALGVGQGENLLDINVDNLSAKVAAGGLFLNELDSINIGEIADITVNRVNKQAASSSITDTLQAGLVSTTGAIVLMTQTGDVTILSIPQNKKGVLSSGNILLKAAQNLTMQAAIETARGSINLISGGVFEQQANLNTILTGTIDVIAENAIVMDKTAITKTMSNNISYRSGGDLTVSLIDAGLRNIALIADKNIIGSNANVVDIIARALYLQAGDAVGSKEQSLDIASTILAASSENGIFIKNKNETNINKVTVTTNFIDVMGISKANQPVINSDLFVHNDGNIELTAPKITILDGNLNKVGIRTQNAGDIVLQSTSGDTALNASIQSNGGNLRIFSNKGILQKNISIETNSYGNIELSAKANINMMKNATIKAELGDVTLKTSKIVSLSNNIFTTGNVRLIESG